MEAVRLYDLQTLNCFTTFNQERLNEYIQLHIQEIHTTNY